MTLHKARAVVRLLLILLFLEVASRAILRTAVSEARRERFDDLYLRTPDEYAVLPHPYLKHVGQSYAEVRARLLEDAFSGKRPDTIYIAALGGSTTADGWPELVVGILQNALRANNISKDVVMYNFGTGEWNSLQSILNYYLLIRVLPPDIVIVHHNTNDMGLFEASCFSEWWDDSVIQYPETTSLERAILRRSHLARLLKHLELAARDSPGDALDSLALRSPMVSSSQRAAAYLYPMDSQPLAAAQSFHIDFVNAPCSPGWENMTSELLIRNYDDFIRFARAQGVSLVLTTQYLNYSKRRPAGADESLTAAIRKDIQTSWDINDMLKATAERNGILLVDLDRQMRNMDHLLLPDGVHWHQEGVRMKAELIGQTIAQMLIAEGRPPESERALGAS